MGMEKYCTIAVFADSHGKKMLTVGLQTLARWSSLLLRYEAGGLAGSSHLDLDRSLASFNCNVEEVGKVFRTFELNIVNTNKRDLSGGR